MSKVLIVDDNDKYATVLQKYFEDRSILCTRALNAKEGLNQFHQDPKSWSAIVTDVTMETQTSGLWMLRHIHQFGFQGEKIIASTGFDQIGVMALGYWILPWFCGCGWMIPKVPLKTGNLEWHATRLINGSSLSMPSFLT